MGWVFSSWEIPAYVDVQKGTSRSAPGPGGRQVRVAGRQGLSWQLPRSTLVTAKIALAAAKIDLGSCQDVLSCYIVPERSHRHAHTHACTRACLRKVCWSSLEKRTLPAGTFFLHMRHFKSLAGTI